MLLAFIAIPGPAAAEAGLPSDGSDARCDGRRAIAFERRVSEAQAFRQALDLPSDRPHVVRVLRDPRYRGSVRQYHQPLTPQELSYVRDRQALQSKTDLVERYVEENAREDFVSLRIEDDFPSGAYIAVRFARDVERHAGALSLLGLRIRVIAAPFTQQELKAIAERIWPEHDRLAAEGIWLSTWGVSQSENAVIVSVISARPDAVELVERLFGPAVRAEVIASKRYRKLCTSAGGYSVGASGRTLRVFWKTNSAFKLVRVKVRETAHSVRIAIIERAPSGPVTAAAKSPDVLVRLKAPLGRRAVVDAETGRRLRAEKRRRLRHRLRR